MSFPLQDARLCLDCETVFDDARCPRCSSESYFPLSRWVRPALANDSAVVSSKAKKASLVLLGSGVAYGMWKLLQKSDKKPSLPSGPPSEPKP